jgi:hypothetical protein
MIKKSIIFYKIDTKKNSFSLISSNRNNRLRYETKIDHEMKKIDFKIVFDRVRKIRKKSHLSNVAFQQNYLSCLVYYLNQETTWRITCRWDLKWNINKIINYWINEIFDEKTNSRIKFDNHFYFFISIQLINYCRFIFFDSLNKKN